jgi:D-3-phosphoglycerate dehydrogenase
MNKVLLTQAIRPIGMQILSAEVDVVVAPDRNEETILEMIGEFDALISRTTRISRDIIEKGGKLKAIAAHGVGVNLIDVDAATTKGICVLNAPGANSQSVAEFIVGMMLSLSRNLIPADYAQRVERHFEARDKFMGNDLTNKTLGIIGMGQIGRKLAKICIAGFEMRVLGYDPYVTKKDLADIFVEKADQVETLLKESDFVSINCPFTNEVENLINDKTLELMRPTAYLINCARAQVVEEQALLRALTTNRIAGYATDVYWEEPPRADSPIFDIPNVIATPHIAAFSNQSMDLVSQIVASDILRVLRGEEPTNLYNRKVLTCSNK